MSYTTQRDFFNVSFHNEEPKPPERKRSDAALMLYDFCTDGRAWALDKQKQSNYILDVVHKARFKKALLHPEGQFELTKDYLVSMEVHDLADYILSLQAEVRRKNETVQQMDSQLQAVQQRSEDLNIIQRQSAILEQERNEFEQQLGDLEEVIVNLKDRADRYDLLAKENQLLRCQLQKQQGQAADKMRLASAEAEANFNRMRAKDYERLEAELVIFKTQYEELRKQKRELKEQLEVVSINVGRISELKRQLANEQAQREKAEEAMEHLLNLYDKQYQELQNQNEFTATSTGQRAESIRKGQSLSPEQEEQIIEDRRIRRSSAYHTDSQPLKPAEKESCTNCKQLEREVTELKKIHQEKLKTSEEERQSLTEKLQALQNELKSTAGLQDDQARQLAAKLQQTQAELEAEAAKSKTIENELQDVRLKLQDESRKLEQLTTELASAHNQSEELKKQFETNLATFSADRGSADSQLLELEQQLKQAKEELMQKIELVDKMTEQNTQLQSAASNCQTKINDLEQAAQQKLVELEATQSELQKARQELVQQSVGSIDDSALKALENRNGELQKEVSKLEQELATALAGNKELIESSGNQAKLLETVAALKAELQVANDTLVAKDAEINRLAEDIGIAESVQLVTDTRSFNARLASVVPDKQVAVDEPPEETSPLTVVSDQMVAREVTQVDTSLPSVETDKLVPSVDASLKSADVTEFVSVDQPTVDDEQQKDQAGIRDLRRISKDLQKKLSLDQRISKDLQNKLSLDQHELDAVGQKDLTEDDVIVDQTQRAEKIQEEKDLQISGATLEDVDEQSSHSSGDEGDEESESESEPEKETEATAEARKLSITADEVIHRLNESFAGMGNTVAVGYSDPCKTKLIAMKIVKHGISILILPELDHLHREIYRVTLERYLMLGKTVQVLDDAFCDNCNILHTMQSMGNNELMAMIAPSVQVPAASPLLLNDQIPTRLPPEPGRKRTLPNAELNLLGVAEKQQQKPRAKSTDPKETRIFSLFTKGSPVPGHRLALPKKSSERILVDRCRMRPWRAP
ncbi:myosin-10-like [Sabethes cyaneus]|uniref:myosin-10-like n=1 Tax=Sabethes cyaneus TaxID=53552 RepID=UPI00237E21C0|nr:myosin-10-like [Sabethes cyaneus]